MLAILWATGRSKGLYIAAGEEKSWLMVIKMDWTVKFALRNALSQLRAVVHNPTTHSKLRLSETHVFANPKFHYALEVKHELALGPEIKLQRLKAGLKAILDRRFELPDGVSVKWSNFESL